MTPLPFTRLHLVRFSDCNPSGIVFYPQYFAIFNGLVEDWFNEGLGIDYEKTISQRRIGLPTVQLDADFEALCRAGEEVELSLGVKRLGTRSLTLQLRCTGRHDGIVRMRGRQVLVAMSLDTYASLEIPPDIREAVARCAGTVQ